MFEDGEMDNFENELTSNQTETLIQFQVRCVFVYCFANGIHCYAFSYWMFQIEFKRRAVTQFRFNLGAFRVSKGHLLTFEWDHFQYYYQFCNR